MPCGPGSVQQSEFPVRPPVPQNKRTHLPTMGHSEHMHVGCALHARARRHSSICLLLQPLFESPPKTFQSSSLKVSFLVQLHLENANLFILLFQFLLLHLFGLFFAVLTWTVTHKHRFYFVGSAMRTFFCRSFTRDNLLDSSSLSLEAYVSGS